MSTDMAIYSLSERNEIWHADHLPTLVEFYAAFDYDGVKFLCGGCYGAVFWISVGNSVDNTGMFSLLLSKCSRYFLPLTPPHLCREWGYTSSEETHLGQLIPTDQRNNPDCITSCSAYNTGGSRSNDVCLPKHCQNFGAWLFGNG